MLEDVAAGRARDAWTAAVDATLTSHDIEALLPAIAPSCRFIPECLSPVPERMPLAPQDEIERIAGTTADDLLAELSAPGGPGINGLWLAVSRDPERWLRRYVDIVHRSVNALADEWSSAKADFDREFERVGVAVARGAAKELIAGIRPEQPLKDGNLVFARPNAIRDTLDLRVGPRGLVLLPRFTGDPFRAQRRYDGDVITHLDYVVPGPRQRPPADESPASLEALLGPTRARILRHLERPLSVGALAELLITVPSAVTHHTASLGSAGLVERDRRGRHVLISRTPRGTALLAMYDG